MFKLFETPEVQRKWFPPGGQNNSTVCSGKVELVASLCKRSPLNPSAMPRPEQAPNTSRTQHTCSFALTSSSLNVWDTDGKTGLPGECAPNELEELLIMT